MIAALRPLIALILSKEIKRVIIKIERKREGVYVDVSAFTGKHTFGVASYAHRFGSDAKKTPSLAGVLQVAGRRLSDLRGMLALDAEKSK